MVNQNKYSVFKTFIARKRYKGLSLNKMNLNIPMRSELFCEAGVLFYKDIPVAFATSQVSLDYFTENDDGEGMKRGKIIEEILSILVNKPNNSESDNRKRLEAWDRVWSSEFCVPFKREDHSDFWLWNYEFYNTSVNNLKIILQIVKGGKNVSNLQTGRAPWKS